MALNFFWRCEGTTLDGTHDFSAGDTTATATNTPAISATAAKIGSNGQLFDSGSDRYAFTPTGIISTTAGAVGFWLHFPTAFPASGGAYVFYSQGTNSNDYIRIETLSGGGAGQRKLRLGIRNNGGAASNLDLVTANLTSGQWYFVAASWDTTVPSKRLTVLDASGTVLENATSGAAVTAPVNITNWLFGDITGGTGTMYIDNVFVAGAAADIDAIITARDITSYTSWGASGIAGTLAATDEQDTAAIAGELDITGDLTVTEAQDTAALSGTVEAAPGAITGTLAATDTQDTAAIAGELDVTGDLAATEAQDTASASGTVEQPPGPIAGTLTATDTQDTAAIAGEIDITGDLSATEAQDAAAIAGSVAQLIGDLEATDPQDIFVIDGELALCIPKVLNMRAPDLDGLLAVAFLDRHERFAKRDEDVAEVRLFYGVQYCPPFVSFTPIQFRSLPSVTRAAIRNAGSAAGLIDTEHKSNA
jgi:hypothetical protein